MRRLLCLCLCLLPALPASALELVASTRPLALLAQAVAGERLPVQQLLPTGVSPHDFQLRPSDRQRLAQADVLLWTGPANEPYLARVAGGAGAERLSAQDLPGVRVLPRRQTNAAGVLAGSIDSHLWLAPDNAAVIARALAELLARRDAPGAALYRRNAEALASRLARFKAAQAQRFSPLPSRRYLSYHDAYQYLEPVLGLTYRGSLVQAAEARPGARHLLLLSTRVRDEGIACLLGEPGFDRALARRMFAGQPSLLVSVDDQFAGVADSVAGYEQGLGLVADGIYRCLGGH